MDFSKISHNPNATTHLTGISNSVLEPYDGYPLFLNGDFDFTNLEIDYENFEFSFFNASLYSETSGYTGMVYYSNYGDVTGDGKTDAILSGWTVNTGSSPGRLFLIEFTSAGGIEKVQWVENEGTAAPWVEDFDGDGIHEILSVGFYDFPVAPAPTYFFDGSLENLTKVGPLIDSHESSVVDFDGDGDLDVVAISYYKVNGLISLYRNDGSSFTHEYLPNDSIDYFATGSSIEYADLDNDGTGEFIIGDYAGDGGIAILKIEPDGSFANSSDWLQVLEARPYFERSEYSGINSKFSSSNPAATEAEIVKMRSHDILLKAVDIDLDGDLDLLNSTSVWHTSTPFGVLQILINDGNGNFTDETDDRLYNYSLTANASHDLVLVDVNNDGFLDILASDDSSYNSSYNEVERLHLGKLSEGNTILLNDGEGNYLNIMFAPFSREGTFKEDGSSYPNKWFPVIHKNGTLGYVQLDHAWKDYPNGEYDVINYAQYTGDLHTGPRFVNSSEYGAPGFNEFYVLRTNPNVQKLVLEGEYGSALEWYLKTTPSNLKTFAKGAKIVGSTDDDLIILREGDETTLGLQGDDTINGGSGNDTIDGGAGDDIIEGGLGDDKLIGGLGADTFKYFKGDGNDTILDFNSKFDKIKYDGFSDLEISNFIETVFERGQREISFGDGSYLTLEEVNSFDVSTVCLTRGGSKISGADVAMSGDTNSSSYKSASDGSVSGTIMAGSASAVTVSLVYSNSTKAISSQDALDALKLSVGLTTSAGTKTAFGFISADFNQDGKVSSQDALSILKYSVGLPTSEEAKWVFVDTNGDYSGVSKSNTSYTEGVSIADLSADTSVSLTGILIGDVNDSYSGLIA